MVRGETRDKDRHSNDVKSSVRAPAKKDGGGGKFTLGKEGDYSGGATVDYRDPNYDPDERRIDPDDGTAYKYDELAAFYKGKFTAQEISEYWEYECTAIKRKVKAKAKEVPLGPSPAESAIKAKWEVKGSKQLQEAKAAKRTEDLSGGNLAKEVAAVIPYYPFQQFEKFYDLQGLLQHANLFEAVCNAIAKRYRSMGVTKIAVVEARGFLFTPVAIKLEKPLVLLRKPGKMPNTISSKEHSGADAICVQKGAIEAGDKVALIDDFIASAETLCAGIEVVKACKGEVVECTGLVELKALNGRIKCLKAGARDVWSLCPEDTLTTKAELPADYVDDGAV